MTEPWSERDSEFKSSRARARGLVAHGAGVGLLLALLFFIAQLFVTQPGAAARGVPLRVATGAAGGRYHQLGLALAERWGAGNLADLAAASGYADQAHMTREIRRLSGRTPTALLTRARSTLGLGDPLDGLRDRAAG